MRTRTIAAVEAILIFPSVLFMTALVVRNLESLHHPSANVAQQLVMWYAARMRTLWVLLLFLPFVVLLTGSVTLLESWKRDIELRCMRRQLLSVFRTDFATLVVASITVISAGILTIVVLHMLAN